MILVARMVVGVAILPLLGFHLLYMCAASLLAAGLAFAFDGRTDVFSWTMGECMAYLRTGNHPKKREGPL
ncbi:MAG: hypothetical protein ACYTEQ_31340 [Planctomycetota bacterium]|jgi:hypothetical protein